MRTLHQALTGISQGKPRSESYLHETAKGILSSWWMDEYYLGIVPVRIDSEKCLSMSGYIQFIPDLIIYDIQGIRAFCEIEHKNPVSLLKVWKIWQWTRAHGINPLIIQIQASWIMGQVNPPKKLICEILSDFESLINVNNQ